MRISRAILILAALLSFVLPGRSDAAVGGGGRSGGYGGGHFAGGHFGGHGGWHGNGGEWHGGHGYWHGDHGDWHGGHGGWYGVYVGSPWWWYPLGPFPDWYYPDGYAGYPSVTVQQAPPVYVQKQPAPSDEAQAYWYYCPNPKGYYPKVPNCPEAWIRVPPSPN